MPQRPLALGLLAQPERTHQRNLRAAVGRFATHRARPQIGNRRRPVRVLGIQIRQLLLRLPLNLAADPAQFLGQPRPVPRNVLQHHLENQARHRIQIAGERLAAQPQRLQRNRTPARKRVHHERRLLAMRRLHQRPTHVEMGAIRSIVPIGEVGDERQQPLPQFRVIRRRLPHRAQNLPRLLLKVFWTVFVARVRQQQRQPHRHNTARDEANGRRAHHRCSVLGCPCRIDFSRDACLETSAMGKSTSARRLHSRGIIVCVPQPSG